MSAEPRPVVFLTGEQVYLRPLELADVQRCQRWLNDEAVRRTVTLFLPLNEKQEREYIESVGTKPDQISFAIVRRDGDRHIGVCGLHDIRWKDRAGAFGLVIGETDCWDRGYGTEATRLVLRYAFETLNFNRLELEVFADNARAIHVYERVGFVREGVRRESSFRLGRYTDAWILSMLAREYFSRGDRSAEGSVASGRTPTPGA